MGTTIKELSKLHIGPNGLDSRVFRTGNDKKAIELVRKTMEAIAFYTAQEEKAKAQRKKLEREFKLTKAGLRIEELKRLEKEGKQCRRELGSRYMGMLETFEGLGLNVDPEQIKKIVQSGGK